MQKKWGWIRFWPSYPPKKKKYPGISLARVGTKPRNNPLKPSVCIICCVKEVAPMYLVSLPLAADWLWTSCIACSLHFISSVGVMAIDEKNEAKKPAVALERTLSSSTLFAPMKVWSSYEVKSQL